MFGLCFAGVTKGCHSREVCFPDSCPDAEWCHDVWRAHACLPRLCLSRPCRNGGTCYEGVDSSGANKYRCICTPKFQGAQCETERAVVASTADPALESGLIIGEEHVMIRRTKRTLDSKKLKPNDCESLGVHPIHFAIHGYIYLQVLERHLLLSK